jgi:small-conductance mechanosensitive channel
MEIHDCFADEGIEIPSPKRDVSVAASDSGSADATATVAESGAAVGNGGGSPDPVEDRGTDGAADDGSGA